VFWIAWNAENKQKEYGKVMRNPIKVCVIGAGSSYTPELVEGLIEKWDELPVAELALMDIDRRKLEIVGGLARRMVAASGREIQVETTLDRQRALEGSQFVVSQIRVGGMEARIKDEKIPPSFGVIGQETTGPGGFAKALRTIPVALAIAEDIAALAPGAFLLNFTNPAGLITEALLRYSNVPTIGLCNLPIGSEMRQAKAFGVDRSQVRLDWVGLNHLNWIRGASIDGEDVWSQVFQRELEAARQEGGDGWNFSPDILVRLPQLFLPSQPGPDEADEGGANPGRGSEGDRSEVNGAVSGPEPERKTKAARKARWGILLESRRIPYLCPGQRQAGSPHRQHPQPGSHPRPAG
jgi:hypothetical protein